MRCQHENIRENEGERGIKKLPESCHAPPTHTFHHEMEGTAFHHDYGNIGDKTAK